MFVSSCLELGSRVRHNCLNYYRIQEVLGHLRTILGIYDSREEFDYYLPARAILDTFGIGYGTAYFVCHNSKKEFRWYNLYDLEIKEIQELVKFFKDSLLKGKTLIKDIGGFELEEGL